MSVYVCFKLFVLSLCTLIDNTDIFTYVPSNLLKLRHRSFVENSWFLSLCLLPCRNDLPQIGGNLLSLIPAQGGRILKLNSAGEE